MPAGAGAACRTCPESAYFPLAPDWICEILSPSTAQLDRAKKLAIYAREQVAHAWLIDPSLGLLEVLRLEGGRWTILGTHYGAEVVRAEPFGEIELESGGALGGLGTPASLTPDTNGRPPRGGRPAY